MKQDQRQRLVNILSIQAESGKTASMRSYLKAALIDAGMTVVSRDRMLFARKGRDDIKVPFYVAHADTVHRIVPEEHYRVAYYMDKGELVYHAVDPLDKTGLWRGVGGDDKCGLWVALEAAYALDNVGVIITRDEEIGCKGARRVSKDDLSGASVLIQADRRGKSDAVWKTWAGEIAGNDWKSHVGGVVKTYGYNWCQYGAGTDVSAMHETGAAGVSAVNLSAGYYNPHLASEYVHEGDVEQCMEMAIELGLKSGAVPWDHKLVKPAHVVGNARNYARGTSTSGAAPWVQRRIDNKEVRLTHAVTGKDAAFGSWGRWDVLRQLWVSEDEQLVRVYVGSNRIRYTADEVAYIESIEPFADHMNRVRNSFANARYTCAVERCQFSAVVLDCMSALWLCRKHEEEFLAPDAPVTAKQREVNFRIETGRVRDTPEAVVEVVKAPIIDGEFRAIV